MLSREREINISSNNNEYFDKYLHYVLTADSQDITKNDCPQEDDEQINKYHWNVCNINYKNPLRYNKHIRADDAFSVFYRLEAILPKYCPNGGYRDFFKTNADLKNI